MTNCPISKFLYHYLFYYWFYVTDGAMHESVSLLSTAVDIQYQKAAFCFVEWNRLSFIEVFVKICDNDLIAPSVK